MKEVLQILHALENGAGADGSVAALATLVSVEGSSYRRAGARMLWWKNHEGRETRIGGISGGCLENDLSAHCREVSAQGTARVVTYDTRDENDLVWGVGTGCTGVVRVLVEPVRGVPAALAHVREVWARREVASVEIFFGKERIFFEQLPPPVSLVIFGAGGDVEPLARMSEELGWNVRVLKPDAATTVPDLDERTCVVVMTHRYVCDVPLMRALLPSGLAYLGLLGPKKRAEKIYADLERDGFCVTPEMRARVHAPVGLDLGGDTPESVALAILAEIQSVLSRRSARPLRERTGAIHDE